MATCDKDLIKTVGDLCKLGIPPLTAALQNGVSEQEFIEWMRRGEVAGRGEWRYAEFYEAVTAGQAQAEGLLVGRIRSSAENNWQAAAWLLERLWPERYVRKQVGDQTAGRAGTPGQADPFAKVDKVVPIDKKRQEQAG